MLLLQCILLYITFAAFLEKHNEMPAFLEETNNFYLCSLIKLIYALLRYATTIKYNLKLKTLSKIFKFCWEKNCSYVCCIFFTEVNLNHELINFRNF